MNVYTSYFDKIYCLPRNLSLVSIAGKTPDYVQCVKMSEFAPKYEWWQKWHDKFKNDLDSDESRKWYFFKYQTTVLQKLNIIEIISKFSKMGTDICLLCYEPPEKFCHRHLVAEWLNNNGIRCQEYVFN